MAPAALDIILRTPPTGLRSLTLSNVVTDATRRAAMEGDGQAEPGGLGVWPAATNRCINGNATTNPTGITDNSSTTTRVTTGTVKFGSTAFEVVSGNAAANEGPSQSISGGAASTQYTVSAWAWLVSGAATVRATLQDNVSGKQGGTAVVLTSTPQKVQVTATTGGGAVTFNSFIETTVQQAGTWRCGGWQVETGAVATPYVQTDGGTATRSAGSVTLPTQGLFTPTQGWCFMRKRMGHTQAQQVSTASENHGGWYDDVNNRVFLALRNSAGTGADQIAIFRIGGGAGGVEVTAAITYALGQSCGLLWEWTASAMSVAFDGAAPTSGAAGTIPVIAATTLNLGGPISLGGFDWDALTGNAYYVIYGKGTLNSQDRTTLNAFGSTVPTLSQIAQLSAASKPTLLIPARTADAVLLPAYFGNGN